MKHGFGFMSHTCITLITQYYLCCEFKKKIEADAEAELNLRELGRSDEQQETVTDVYERCHDGIG